MLIYTNIIIMILHSSIHIYIYTGQSSPNQGVFGSTQYAIEQHHSLRPPIDKSQVYWSFGGSSVLTKYLLRLTPTTQDRRGWIWNEYPLESTAFEIEIRMEVQSKPHFGGDGLAIWLIKPPSDDPAFAQQVDAFNGGVFGKWFDLILILNAHINLHIHTLIHRLPHVYADMTTHVYEL